MESGSVGPEFSVYICRSRINPLEVETSGRIIGPPALLVLRISLKVPFFLVFSTVVSSACNDSAENTANRRPGYEGPGVRLGMDAHLTLIIPADWSR